MLDAGIDHIIGTQDVGLDGFQGIKFAGRDLFQSSGMEDIIHTLESILDRFVVSDIADIEFQLLGIFRILLLIFMTHVILFLLITGQDPDLPDIAAQEAFRYSIAKRSGSSGNQ